MKESYLTKPKAPIGFGRRDPDPNGTGDGFKWLDVDPAEEEKKEEKPKREPKVVPVYVGHSEAQDIMFAYDIYPLAPLTVVEHQLLQVIAALEQKVEQLGHD